MNSLTQLITQEIKKQYKSVRAFSFAIGVPQTTIVSSIKNGISGTGFDTVVKMCNALNIKIVDFDTPVVINEETINFMKKLNDLDEKGLHAVKAVLQAEYLRCNSSEVYEGLALSFGGDMTGVYVTDAEKNDAANALHNIRKND